MTPKSVFLRGCRARSCREHGVRGPYRGRLSGQAHTAGPGIEQSFRSVARPAPPGPPQGAFELRSYISNIMEQRRRVRRFWAMQGRSSPAQREPTGQPGSWQNAGPCAAAHAPCARYIGPPTSHKLTTTQRHTDPTLSNTLTPSLLHTKQLQVPTLLITAPRAFLLLRSAPAPLRPPAPPPRALLSRF